jgi:hypothetical protein
VNGWQTAHSPDALAKVPAGPFTMLDPAQTVQALDVAPQDRPRIYAFVERGVYANQIIRLHSFHTYTEHRDTLGAVWLSGTTISDMIRRA